MIRAYSAITVILELGYPTFNMVAPILQTTSSSTIKGGNPAAQSRLSSPLQYSGSLNSFSHSDLTPVIGREYTGIQITDILKSENSDQIIQDFAVTGE